MNPPVLTKVQTGHLIRRHVGAHFYDDSALSPAGTAIYSLSDPRDIRLVRYVGQTSAPRRRFLQHLHAARLWFPAETPWWIRSPKLRPLYEWIRELYGDDRRLPVMVVTGWVEAGRVARLAERARIYQCLQERQPLLNFESELLGRQLQLI